MGIMRSAVLAAAVFGATGAMAQQFNSGIPTGWTEEGTVGTLGADGVVTLSPATGSTAYGYVTTDGSAATGIGYGLGHETNGSQLTSSAFTANAGDPLQFYFNYVTSDGSTFADYGFANLIDATTGNVAAVLFNARTEPSGSIAPGVGLPTPVATLTPASVGIIGGAPAWSPLGGDSGSCFAAGCGYTGWIQSSYTIATAGSYELQFGVTNWNDTAFASGLAFDGITVAGTSITPPPVITPPPPPPPPVTTAVPEPGTYGLMLCGLGLLAMVGRRRVGGNAAAV